MARRSLKPQLNQIRTWVRQGRTDAWIAHQLEVSVRDISAFKRDHDLVPDEGSNGGTDPFAGDELDLRAEDDALVAAALEAEQEDTDDEDEDEDTERGRDPEGEREAEDEGEGDEDGDERPKRRRRGRRGGRGRRKARKPLDGTFDHGDEGYGLWLDPAVQDDPVYAEHWAGHRPVTVKVEPERIVITRAGEDGSEADE